MPVYSYRAIAADASLQTGRLQAANEKALERSLNLQGLTLIEARRRFSLPMARLAGERRMQDGDLLELTYLLMLVNASGVPILEGINDVLAGREKTRLQPVFAVLADGLRAGMSLSGVMQGRPDIFPVYYAQIIHAGEVSGTLNQSIGYLMNYLDWQINFKKSIRSFLRYPLLILLMLMALAGLLFTFVFPSLGKVLTGLKVDLPLPTQVLFNTAALVQDHFLIFFSALVVLVVAGRLALKTKQGRHLWDRWVLGLPLVGELVTKINLSRYFKTLATLLSAGINIQSTFTTASEVASNVVVKSRLKSVTAAVTTGEDISAALRNIDLVQPLVVSMVVIGEKTGRLDDALTRASDIFDKEVPETIKKVFAFVEPMTIIVLGFMLLIVLLSIFLPIYSVVGNLNVR